MLKVLEDAPAHAYFILCTTDPQKIIPTVRNRCMQFEVQSLNDKELIGLMADVLGRLDIQGFPQDALREIAVVADGCPRQALMILDKVVDMEDSEMMSAIEQMRYGADKGVPDLCRALLAGKKWPEIVKILKQMDLSNNALEGVRLGVMGYMANVLLGAKGMSPEAVTAALVIDYFEKPWYNMGRAGLVKACFGAVVGDK
uniref:Putative DNA polymerase n=1 Tax=viral metagenome TaxID=1070528 RepID=A0A6M3ILE8_9ZZZZ